MKIYISGCPVYSKLLNAVPEQVSVMMSFFEVSPVQSKNRNAKKRETKLEKYFREQREKKKQEK